MLYKGTDEIAALTTGKRPKIYEPCPLYERFIKNCNRRSPWPSQKITGQAIRYPAFPSSPLSRRLTRSFTESDTLRQHAPNSASAFLLSLCTRLHQYSQSQTRHDHTTSTRTSFSLPTQRNSTLHASSLSLSPFEPSPVFKGHVFLVSPSWLRCRAVSLTVWREGREGVQS